MRKPTYNLGDPGQIEVAKKRIREEIAEIKSMTLIGTSGNYRFRYGLRKGLEIALEIMEESNGS